VFKPSTDSASLVVSSEKKISVLGLGFSQTKPKRRENRRLAFAISLHLVLNLNVGTIFALPSLFPYL